MRLTAAQLRAARALMGVSADEFAKLAGMGVATVRRAEASDGMLNFRDATSDKIAAAFHHLGVEAFAAGEPGEGVRRCVTGAV